MSDNTQLAGHVLCRHVTPMLQAVFGFHDRELFAAETYKRSTDTICRVPLARENASSITTPAEILLRLEQYAISKQAALPPRPSPSEVVAAIAQLLCLSPRTIRGLKEFFVLATCDLALDFGECAYLAGLLSDGHGFESVQVRGIYRDATLRAGETGGFAAVATERMCFNLSLEELIHTAAETDFHLKQREITAAGARLAQLIAGQIHRVEGLEVQNALFSAAANALMAQINTDALRKAS
jgi:hypothetical protein